MPVLSTIHDPERLFDLAPRWEDLIAACPDATPFQTQEWVAAWWRAYGGGRRIRVLALSEGSDLVALYPLFRTRSPWRALRAVGTGGSDYLHPLVRPGYETAFVATFREYATQVSDVDLLDLHQLREDLSVSRLLAAESGKPHAECCLLDLPRTYDEFLLRLGKSLRQDVRSLTRPVHAGRGARVRSIRDPAEVQGAMDALFGLHTARWRKRAMPGAFASRRGRDLHREYAVAAAASGRLRVSALEADGAVVAVLYAMRVGTTVFFYQSGISPDAKELCPGTVLVAHTIREAIDEGAEVFDMMRGVEPYKLRWKPQRRVANLRLLAPMNQTRGRLGHAFNRTGSRIEARLRARLEGRGVVA